MALTAWWVRIRERFSRKRLTGLLLHKMGNVERAQVNQFRQLLQGDVSMIVVIEILDDSIHPMHRGDFGVYVLLGIQLVRDSPDQLGNQGVYRRHTFVMVAFLFPMILPLDVNHLILDKSRRLCGQIVGTRHLELISIEVEGRG
jgi:hypothetical protein